MLNEALLGRGVPCHPVNVGLATTGDAGRAVAGGAVVGGVVVGGAVVGGAVVGGAVVGGAVVGGAVVGGAVVGGAVVGGGGAVTVTVNVSVVVNAPSDTVTVMVVMPTPRGVMSNTRRAPVPLITMPLAATTAGSDDAAVTVSEDASCSASPISTLKAGTAAPSCVAMSTTSVIVGAVFEFRMVTVSVLTPSVAAVGLVSSMVNVSSASLSASSTMGMTTVFGPVSSAAHDSWVDTEP